MRLAVAATLLTVVPGVARPQGVDVLPAGARVRVDFPGGERSFLGGEAPLGSAAARVMLAGAVPHWDTTIRGRQP